MSETPPFVTVVVPTLNEELYIEACLASLLDGAQDICREVLVVDGGSSDRTVALAEAMRATQPEITIVRNPKRLQAVAVNLGAALASPESTILLRADAHARYPADFIRTCVRALVDNGATSVVVPMITQGTNGMQRAVAAVQNSRLGNGGSPHRSGGVSRFVDHGHHAAFDRTFFQRIGGYNESFSHNEDAEFDVRGMQAGGRIWMCREAAVWYFPRGSLGGVARQYARHGRGRARTLLLHGIRPKARQMAPLVIFAGCSGGLVLAPFAPISLAVPLVYGGICLGWGILAAIQQRDFWLTAMGPVAISTHFGWAIGFLSELGKQLIALRLRKPREPIQANRPG